MIIIERLFHAILRRRISEIRDLTSEKIFPTPLDTAAQIPRIRIYKSSVDA